jgi:hypothetical protein
MRTNPTCSFGLFVAAMLMLCQVAHSQIRPAIGRFEGWVSCDSTKMHPWGPSYLNIDSVPSHERITSLYLSSAIFALTKSGAVYGSPLAERFVGDTLDEMNRNSFVFRLIPFDKPVKMVAGMPSQFAMYLTYDGDVYATSDFPEYLPLLFGSDQTTPVYRPKKLLLPKKVRTISGGGGSALALLEDGTVWSWGNNGGGVSARNPDSFFVAIGQVEGLSRIRMVRSSESHGDLGPCYAIDSSGTLYTWGTNEGGQIGDGTRTNRSTPYRLDLTDVVDAKGGRYHSIALQSDGSVWTWGSNSYGQLGLPSYLASFTPKRVTSLPPIREIYSSRMSCFAVDSTGQWWTWGQNLDNLMLGISKRDAVLSPIRMTDPCSATSVADSQLPHDLEIHPQPAASYVTIRHGLSTIAVTIEIVDVLGRPVITVSTTLDYVPIDVSSLPPGTYVARCTGDAKVVNSVFHVAR